MGQIHFYTNHVGNDDVWFQCHKVWFPRSHACDQIVSGYACWPSDRPATTCWSSVHLGSMESTKHCWKAKCSTHLRQLAMGWLYSQVLMCHSNHETKAMHTTYHQLTTCANKSQHSDKTHATQEVTCNLPSARHLTTGQLFAASLCAWLCTSWLAHSFSIFPTAAQQCRCILPISCRPPGAPEQSTHPPGHRGWLPLSACGESPMPTGTHAWLQPLHRQDCYTIGSSSQASHLGNMQSKRCSLH